MGEKNIAVVDADNRFLRWDDRETVHGERLSHRSVHILVFDNTGRLLLQQRNADKLTYPLHWDISVAGHVEADDYPAGPDDDLDAVYAAVAKRELAEELGILAPVSHLHTEGPRDGVHYEHLRLYEATWSGTIVMQDAEVHAVRWLSPAEWDRRGSELNVTHALSHWVNWLRAQGRFGG